MKYILIESIEAYYHAKKIYEKKLDDVTWITTSPFIINYLSENSIQFVEIEKYINHDELNDLQKICMDFQEFFLEYLNKENKWRDYIDFKYIYASQYHSYLSMLIYKCSIINKIKQNFKGNIIIVGDPSEKKEYDFSNHLPDTRFKNYYAIIANKYFPDIKIINFEQDEKTILKKHFEVKKTKMSFEEKILSLLNNNLSSIFFKIILKLIKYKVINKIKLFYKKKSKQVVLYDQTDTIECSFFSLLNRGYEFKFLNLPNLILQEPSIQEIDEIYSKNKLYLSEKFKKIFFNYNNVKYDSKFELILNSTFKKIFYRILKIKKNINVINKNFDKKYKEFDNNHLFFSNYIFDELPLIYAMYVKNIKKIKIIFFEHGIVQGLQIAQKYRINFNPMHLADIGVYTWKKSLLFEKDLSHQKVVISGLSYKQYGNKFENIKKILIKKYLQIKNNKDSIIYIADIEKNNFISGPYLGTDLDYYHNTRECIKYLCEKNPSKNVFLKLYPTNRYMQNYDFEDLKREYKNLYIIRKIDFRFIREIFEKIYISSYQSTLGWALASTKPVYLLESNVIPINLEGLIKEKISWKIKGTKNCILLNKNFEKDNSSWMEKIK